MAPWRPTLHHYLSTAFFHYGLFLHRFKWTVLIVSIAWNAALIPGIPIYLVENTVNDFNYIFVPQGPERTHALEKAEFDKRWPHKDDDFYAESSFNDVRNIFVSISSKVEGSNLLDLETMKEIVNIEKNLSSLRVPNGAIDDFNNETVTMGYRDICAGHKGHCYMNSDVIELFRFMGPKDPLMNSTDEHDPERVRFFDENFVFRWPRSWKDGKQMSIAAQLSAQKTLTQVDLTDCYKGSFDHLAFIRLVKKLRSISGTRFFNWTEEFSLAYKDVMDSSSNTTQMRAMEEFERLVRESDVLGKVDFANSILLVYYMAKEGEKGRVAELWRHRLTEELLTINSQTNYVKTSLYVTYATLDEAINKLQFAIIPIFALAFFVMISFAVLSAMAVYRRPDGRRAIDGIRSKPIIAVVGTVSAGLAISSSLGVLSYSGIRFNAVVCIMPILVIAIGVDDMFVMNGAWDRTSREHPCALRMAEMMADSAVAITITSATDFLGFFIGCFTDIPCVQLFCMYTALAIALDYVNQVTFFAAFMAIMGDVEEQNRHFLTFQVLHPPSKDDSCVKRLIGGGTILTPICKTTKDRQEAVKAGTKAWKKSKGAASLASTTGILPRFFRQTYGPLLMSKWVGMIVAVFYAIYIAFAIWGCVMMGEGMEMRNVFYETESDGTEGGLGRDFMLQLVHSAWKAGQQQHLLATKLPDLSDPINRQRFNQSLSQFIGLETTMGEDGVYNWLWDYERWHKARTEGRFSLEGSRSFLFHSRLRDVYLDTDADAYALSKLMKFESDVKELNCEENTNASFAELCPFYRLNAIRIHITQRNVENTYMQAVCLKQLRAVAEAESEYGWVVYNAFSPTLDGVIELMPLTMKNIAIAAACMFAVALFLIPSYRGTILVTASVISINVGVFGYMALWGCNIDSVTSISILMSMGFGVDLSAHVTHGFLAMEGTGRERAIRSLETYGAAILEGGLTTLFVPLILSIEIHHYIVQVFVKTIFLVITFGIVHSLLFMPHVLALCIPSSTYSCLPERRDKIVPSSPPPSSDVKKSSA